MDGIDESKKKNHNKAHSGRKGRSTLIRDAPESDVSKRMLDQNNIFPLNLKAGIHVCHLHTCRDIFM